MKNSGYGKNGSDDVYSDSSLYMRFRIHLYELPASFVCVHWNTMQQFQLIEKRITIPSAACYIDFMDAALLVSKFSSS